MRPQCLIKYAMCYQYVARHIRLIGTKSVQIYEADLLMKHLDIEIGKPNDKTIDGQYFQKCIKRKRERERKKPEIFQHALKKLLHLQLHSFKESTTFVSTL